MPARKREPLECVVRRLDRMIESTAYNQYVPGLRTDEVKAEMIEALWRAHRSYRPNFGITLEQYWWTCWLRRKALLIAHFYAQKRDVRKETLAGLFGTEEGSDLSVAQEIARFIPEPPNGADLIGQRVWNLLALGFNHTETMNLCGINRRRYYVLIGQWRNDEVRSALTA